MSLADMFLDIHFTRRRMKPAFVQIPLTASVGTVVAVAAPGANKKIIVWDGVLSGATGAHTWYHTAVDNANRLTAALSHTPDKDSRVGPFVLPTNTPLVVVAAGNGATGWINYSIADE